MSRSKKITILDTLIKGYRKGVRKAVDIASKTNTSLIVEKNDKILAIKPKYKYIRVLSTPSKKKL